MASSLTKLTTITLFLGVMLFLSSQITAFSSDDDNDNYNDDDGDDDNDNYVLDDAPSRASSSSLSSLSRPSRFLARLIKKGTRCEGRTRNVCNGVRANKGKSLLYCCKKHCRNILGDRNNCGRCGRRCRYGQRCCRGRCTDVFFSRFNCGKCGKTCRPGVACDMGYCGYAN